MAVGDRVGPEERGQPLPYPTSLCHRCAAPPKYVRAAAATYICCPLLPNKYPRQPVLYCPLFRPAATPPDASGDAR